MKKRLTALSLAIALVFALLPAAVLTASAETYSGACGSNLTWTLDTETGVLEISGTGEMEEWFSPNGIPWYSYRDSITSASIGSGVTSIGDYAFCDCTTLTSITLPDGVTSIGVSAFSGCTGLTSITIPNSVTSIGDWAFGRCTGLTSVTLPDGVTSISIGAFDACTGLTSVTIGTGVTTLDSYAFRNCTGLTSITIPDSVTGISSSAFDNTGYYNDTSNWTDGVLFIGKHLVEAKDTIEGDYAIIEGTKTIAATAFSNCTGLTSVTIPSSVTYIGDDAFACCFGLTSVTIPSSVTSIGDWAFYTCTGLTSVTISVGVTSIGDYTFSACDNLKSVTIPGSVMSIGEKAFGYYWNGETRAYEKIDSFTIYGYKNSAAQTYAKENGFIFVDLEDVPCQHEHAHPEHKDATCTEPGYDRMICDDCDEIISETILPAPGHSFKDGVCTVCGAKDPDYKPPVQENPFGDVKEGDFYYDAVIWAVNAQPQVTSGTSATTFSPNDTCTRAQVVTFLWRAKGCPEPKSSNNPFKDVKEGEYYYKAVLWAVENNITAGTSATTFSPNAGCTRAQVVTFLWRTEDQPKPASSSNPFRDVTGGYYYDAVLWAVKKGITAGTSATTFSPNDTCTRGQIVTFLYRDLA